MPAPLTRIFEPDQKFSPNITAFYRYTEMLARFDDAVMSGDIDTRRWFQLIRGLKGLPQSLQAHQ